MQEMQEISRKSQYLQIRHAPKGAKNCGKNYKLFDNLKKMIIFAPYLNKVTKIVKCKQKNKKGV